MLRARVALTTFVFAIPALAAVIWLYARSTERAAEEAHAQIIIGMMQSGGREQCEAAPAAWSGRVAQRRGMAGSYAYDGDFVASNPDAPAIPDELRRRVAQPGASAVRRVAAGGRDLVEVVVRMPWRDGPCSVVLVRRPDVRGARAVAWRLPPVELWVPIVAILLAGALIAIERVVAQERRERALRDFLDNTTHDVMTPLTVLQGHLAALAGDPAHRERIAAAMDEAHYLASLVHNLGLAATLEAGEPGVARERIDLDALIERVAARHLPLARAHRIALERATPGEPLYASGDVTFVEQAVSNVVINAIHHVEAGGHVAIVLDRAAGGRFRIEIVDDGPGMSALELERARERGLRGNDARTRAPHGRGLGLDIAQRVIRLHAWTLTLANAAPRGLSVVIAGPLERE